MRDFFDHKEEIGKIMRKATVLPSHRRNTPRGTNSGSAQIEMLALGRHRMIEASIGKVNLNQIERHRGEIVIVRRMGLLSRSRHRAIHGFRVTLSAVPVLRGKRSTQADVKATQGTFPSRATKARLEIQAICVDLSRISPVKGNGQACKAQKRREATHSRAKTEKR